MPHYVLLMRQDPADRPVSTSPVRIDKWCWAARFFKTRSLAVDAIEGGKVSMGGERVKPARLVQKGDELSIRLGERRGAVLRDDAGVLHPPSEGGAHRGVNAVWKVLRASN